jgi:hypothetical protein
MAAPEIGAIDQQAANARGAHFFEGDLLAWVWVRFIVRSVDGNNDNFALRTCRAIIGSQIKARFLRLDPRQDHGPSANRARRPKIIDKLKIKGVCHGDDQPALLPDQLRVNSDVRLAMWGGTITRQLSVLLNKSLVVIL